MRIVSADDPDVLAQLARHRRELWRQWDRLLDIARDPAKADRWAVIISAALRGDKRALAWLEGAIRIEVEDCDGDVGFRFIPARQLQGDW